MEGPFGVKPGDVFVESWGYDQTNVDFYVVTRVTQSSVYLKPCGARPVGEGMSTRLVPDPSKVGEFRCAREERIGKVNARGEVVKRVKAGWQGEPWLKLTSYSGASLWDGERSYFDTYAAGLLGH